VFGALASFVGSCNDLSVATALPEFECLQHVQGSFVLRDGCSQQRNRPRTIGSRPK
jgi:hypothetical protein